MAQSQKPKHPSTAVRRVHGALARLGAVTVPPRLEPRSDGAELDSFKV
jgi:hypothetical protein